MMERLFANTKITSTAHTHGSTGTRQDKGSPTPSSSEPFPKQPQNHTHPSLLAAGADLHFGLCDLEYQRTGRMGHCKGPAPGCGGKTQASGLPGACFPVSKNGDDSSSFRPGNICVKTMLIQEQDINESYYF